jgi:hypothetical protein
MADVLRTGVSVREQEVHIEQPNGLRGIALVDIEAIKDSDGKQPSPKKSPLPWSATTASLPRSDTMLSLTLPSWI